MSEARTHSTHRHHDAWVRRRDVYLGVVFVALPILVVGLGAVGVLA